MNKLLALIVAAAIIGVVISRTRPAPESDQAQPAQEVGTEAAEEPENAVPLTMETPPLAVVATPSAATPQPVPLPEITPKSRASEVTSRASVVVEAPKPQASGPRTVPAAPLPGAAVAPGGAVTQRQVAAFRTAVGLLKNGNRLEARRTLSDLYRSTDGNPRRCARDVLDVINKELVFNPHCSDGATVHEIQAGEILSVIARKHGVNWRMIARLNVIDRPKIVRAGRKLKILTGSQEILVDKSEFLLALFINGEFIKEYPIGIGKDDRTPAAEFVVDQMLIRPTWYPPEGGVIKYGEKGHLIGERWIGFRDEPGASGLGIHGTNEPQTIRTKCSNGCIRLRNEDIIELYDFVVVGAHVKIVE